MTFWDASAVVPMLVEQPATAAVRAMAEADDAMIAWWATPVECLSAIAWLEADGQLSADHADAARRRLHQLMDTWTEVLAGQRLREQAGRLLRVHRLRAADALQLAAALMWARQQPRGRAICTLDARLAQAAAREGFELPLSIG